MINIGMRIRNIRKQRGLNSKELASKIGVSAGFLSQLENDVKSPSLETLEQICTALDISLSAFFEIPTGMKDTSFGVILKAFRRYRGMSLKELADRLCIPESLVVKWEEEGSKAPISTLIEISSILGVSSDALTGIVSKKANVHNVLKQSTITIAQLSQKTNIDSKTLNDILKDNIIPSLDQVQRICDALGISLVEFYGEDIDLLKHNPLIPDLKELLECQLELKFNGNTLSQDARLEILNIIHYQLSKI